MLHPTEAIAIAPAISSAQLISSAPASSSAPAGLSAQGSPSLRESPDPSARTLEPTEHGSHWLPLAIPERLITRLPRKGGYPQTRRGLSLLPRILRRHQHPPLGCQARSPECSTHFGQSLYELAGLFRTPRASQPGLYSSNICPSSNTHSSLGKAICAAPAHPRTISPYVSSVHNNVSELIYEYTYRTRPTQLDHTTCVAIPGNLVLKGYIDYYGSLLPQSQYVA